MAKRAPRILGDKAKSVPHTARRKSPRAFFQENDNRRQSAVLQYRPAEDMERNVAITRKIYKYIARLNGDARLKSISLNAANKHGIQGIPVDIDQSANNGIHYRSLFREALFFQNFNLIFVHRGRPSMHVISMRLIRRKI